MRDGMVGEAETATLVLPASAAAAGAIQFGPGARHLPTLVLILPRYRANRARRFFVPDVERAATPLRRGALPMLAGVWALTGRHPR